MVRSKRYQVATSDFECNRLTALGNKCHPVSGCATRRVNRIPRAFNECWIWVCCWCFECWLAEVRELTWKSGEMYKEFTWMEGTAFLSESQCAVIVATFIWSVSSTFSTVLNMHCISVLAKTILKMTSIWKFDMFLLKSPQELDFICFTAV